MRAVWHVIIFMTLIMLVGFSIVMSSNHLVGTFDEGSIVYKLKSADMYIEKFFTDIYYSIVK